MKIKLFITCCLIIILGLFISCNDKTNILESSFISELPNVTEQDDLPTRIVLYQNYPNPFNPSTIIRYDLPVALRIDISVYTEDWQEVQTLVKDIVPAGYHQLAFYSENISSGNYYYVLKSGKTMLIGKMTCLK